MGRHEATQPVPMVRATGSAGKPPQPAATTTIDPTGVDADTGPLFIPLEDSDFETDNQGQPMAVHDEVPRTGFGSAAHRAPTLGPAAKAIVKAQRWRRVKRAAFGALFVFLAIPVTLTGAYCGYLAYGYRDDLTYIESREMTPVFAALSSVLFVFLAALVVLYRDGRNG